MHDLTAMTEIVNLVQDELQSLVQRPIRRVANGVLADSYDSLWRQARLAREPLRKIFEAGGGEVGEGLAVAVAEGESGRLWAMIVSAGSGKSDALPRAWRTCSALFLSEGSELVMSRHEPLSWYSPSQSRLASFRTPTAFCLFFSCSQWLPSRSCSSTSSASQPRRQTAM